MKKTLLSCILISTTLLSSAIRPGLQWARQTTVAKTTTDNAMFHKNVLDKGGNILSCGIFSGTIDIDPSAATFNATAIGAIDIIITKMDASGNLIWGKTIGPPGRGAHAYSLATDDAENVYVTGHFGGTMDFDPGVGKFEMTSAGASDLYLLKLDKNGDFVWAVSTGGTGDEISREVAVDKTGNIFIAGYFNATTDLDPGPGTYSPPYKGMNDAYVMKLDNGGSFLWAKTFSDMNEDIASGLVLDETGNVLITGCFMGKVDFDPGPAIKELISTSVYSAFVVKLSSAGDYI